MKLARGKFKYALPAIGQLVSATVVLPGEPEVRVELVEASAAKMAELVRLNPGVGEDVPAFYTHDGTDINVWPTPHRGGQLVVRYYPPEEVA